MIRNQQVGGSSPLAGSNDNPKTVKDLAAPPFYAAVVGEQIMFAISDQLTPDRLSIVGYHQGRLLRARLPNCGLKLIRTRLLSSESDNRFLGRPAQPRTSAHLTDKRGSRKTRLDLSSGGFGEGMNAVAREKN